MDRVPGIRALRFDEIWELYLQLPPSGSRETYLKLLEKRYGRRRKARETLNMLILAGMLRGEEELEKVRVNDRGELRELLARRLLESLNQREGITTKLDGSMSERARKALKSTLRNLGALVPLKAFYISSDCSLSLAAYIFSSGGVKVKELREWAISKGFSDSYFRRCLLSAIKKGLVNPPRPDLFKLWLDKGIDDPPTSIPSEKLSESERRVLESNDDLVSFDFQRGREVATLYSLWSEDDLLTSKLVVG